jgi:hypothetical protein
MKQIFGAAVALAFCAATATPAYPEDTAQPRRDCFRTLEVSGYGVVDEHRVRVRIRGGREYYLTINHNTSDLDWNHAISLQSTLSFICAGDGDGVRLLGGDPPVRAMVTAIERAPAEPATPAPTSY